MQESTLDLATDLGLKQFQAKVEAWNKHNFPGQKPYQSLLGIVEEFCDEATRPCTKEQLADALGDTMVYLADYCFQNDLKLWAIIPEFTLVPRDSISAVQSPKDMAVRAIGMLAHAHLKNEQKIRGDQINNKCYAISLLVRSLDHMAASQGLYLKTCMDVALAEILKRDWIKFPKNGVSD
jgi:hypothetical protein